MASCNSCDQLKLESPPLSALQVIGGRAVIKSSRSHCRYCLLKNQNRYILKSTKKNKKIKKEGRKAGKGVIRHC